MKKLHVDFSDFILELSNLHSELEICAIELKVRKIFEKFKNQNRDPEQRDRRELNIRQ